MTQPFMQQIDPQGGESPNGVTPEEQSSASAQIEDLDAQRIARDAIMKLELFPQLTIMLRKALGYGPHVEMLQHFCFWFHPRHTTMRERWWLYKTFDEWHDECGLSDRQIKKGRKILHNRKLVIETKGPYGRVHYRVDWLALAEALRLDGITDQSNESLVDGEDFEILIDGGDFEISLDDISDQTQIGRLGDRGRPDGISDRPNTGEFAGEYTQENYSLQECAEPAFAEPAPPQQDEKESTGSDVLDPPDSHQPHSQVGETQHETTAARGRNNPSLPPPSPPPPEPTKGEINEMFSAIFDQNTKAGRMALAHLESGEPSEEQIAEAIRIQFQKPEGCADRYLVRLPEVLEQLRLETVGVAP